MSRCVHCARCIRYCDEIMGVGALRFANRGVRSEPATFVDGPMDCELCGNCIEVCPVGALTAEFYDAKARPRDRRMTHTLCQYCGDGCSLSAETKGRSADEAHIIRMRGVPGRGVNDDFLCVRGRFGYGMVNSPDRLTRPLIRREGALVEATWDEALDHVAARLAETRAQAGPEAIGGIGSERVTNEEAYLFGKLMRSVLGTSHVDYRGGAKHSFRAQWLARLLALMPEEGALHRLRRAALTVLVGSDLTSETPWTEKQVILAVTRDGGKQLLAYPRRVRQVEYASQWLRHAPGTEAVLLRGLADLMAGEARAADVAGAVGVTPEEIQSFLAQILAAPDVVFILGPGVTAGPDPDGGMAAAVELVERLRAEGKERAHVVLPALANNTRGAQDMGLLPDTYPGYAGMDARALAAEWGSGLPERPGWSTPEMLEAAERGDLRALYVMGANLAVAFPDGELARRALEKVEFLVVQDLFLTPTAERADVVLPAASFAEKEGTFTSGEGRVQRLRPVLEPVGGSRPDWEILADLARRLGHAWGYLSPAEITREIAAAVPLYAGVSLPALDLAVSQTFVRWGRGPAPRWSDGATARERDQAPAASQPETGERGESFTLMYGPMLFHSGTLSTWAEEMRRIAQHAYVEVAEADAQRLGIRDGAWVRLVGAGAEVEVQAHVQPEGTPGILFLPLHFAEPALNRLLDVTAAVDRVRLELA
ncbi:MAG TPA: molybdopterin-dependent oxidoreductase [Armatimonadetes bacterium]|nr:molybdopterin-dependent oxidoreductase [Armatimonadota bacterium]